MRARALLLAIACSIPFILPASADTCTTTPWSGIAGVPPLTEYPLGYLYLGQYEGSLYDGSNAVPADHDADGLVFRANVQPRDKAGRVCTTPGPDCRIVFLSIGFSNNTIEFCGGQGIGGDPDDPAATLCPLPIAQRPYIQTESFIAKALGDPQVNATDVLLVDGAKGGEALDAWDPTVSGFTQYNRVRDDILTPSNLSPNQVQAIWVKDADGHPTVSLATGGPGNPPDAIVAERHLGNIARGIKRAYPNVQQVFISSRNYGGYANTASPPNLLNPEPYAYELGFSVKWLVESQITQIRGGQLDDNAGDLDYKHNVAPWIAWGPYLWANATTPRGDGLVWLNSDFRYPDSALGGNECTHPSVNGEQKVAGMLLRFMKTAPYTAWFLAVPPDCTIAGGSLRIAADKQTMSWSGAMPSGPFDVATGDLATLRTSGGSFASATCLQDNLTTTSAVDSQVPPLSAGFFYLARCDGGVWDDGTQQGNRGTSLSACP